MNKSFSIGDAAQMSLVTEKQLRHWERQGYLENIQRVVCGKRAYRIYSPGQIEYIKTIKDYLDQGYTLATSAAKTRTELIGEQNYESVDHN